MTGGLLIAATVALAIPSTRAVPLRSPIVDYPPASLKAGEAGRVGYSITVTEPGTVKKCEITASSGYSRLDKATCELMRGMTYSPATQDGRPIAEEKSGVINWAIPAPAPAAVASPTATATAPDAPPPP